MSAVFKRVRRGWYATADGCWAVMSDGLDHVTGSCDYGEAGDGWALVHDPAGRLTSDPEVGENLDWFDTKREAVAFFTTHHL